MDDVELAREEGVHRSILYIFYSSSSFGTGHSTAKSALYSLIIFQKIYSVLDFEAL